MKIKLLMFPVVLILTTVVCLGSANYARAQGREGGKGQGQSNQSPEEASMLRSIASAPDPVAKLKVIAEFVKKFPKSSARPRLAHGAADQIEGVKDPAQRLSYSQEYLKIFDQPSEVEMILPVMIEAYAAANQPDEAFAKGSEFLSKNPDSLEVLVALMLVGTEQAKKQNGKFVVESVQYGTHAIELIEGDKKPAGMEDAAWQQYKTSMLPGMYQSMALLHLVKGDRTEAKARFTKASELAPSDPFNLLMLAGMLNEDYQTEAKRYQGMPAGSAKDEELKKAQGLLDVVIDAYAHSIAVAEGNAPFQQVKQQYLQDLEAYYKYRHNNSTAGMQELINKYKTAPKP
jgi:tetratricopeptide (TPR) repeat protein